MGIFKKKVNCEEYGRLLGETTYSHINNTLIREWFLLEEEPPSLSKDQIEHILGLIPILRLFEVPLILSVWWSPEPKSRLCLEKTIQSFKSIYIEKLFSDNNNEIKNKLQIKVDFFAEIFNKIDKSNIETVPIKPSYPFRLGIVPTEILRRIFEHRDREEIKKNEWIHPHKYAYWIRLDREDTEKLVMGIIELYKDKASFNKVMDIIFVGIDLELLSVHSDMIPVILKYFPKD